MLFECKIHGIRHVFLRKKRKKSVFFENLIIFEAFFVGNKKSNKNIFSKNLMQLSVLNDEIKI